MRAKPCFGPECSDFCAEHGVDGPGVAICHCCGFEGPMCDWYSERDEEEEEKRWEDEQR